MVIDINERIYNKAMSKICRLTRELLDLQTELVNAKEYDLYPPAIVQLQIDAVGRELTVWNEILKQNELATRN